LPFSKPVHPLYNMRFAIIALLAAAATSSAQSVVGTAYGYGAGATGGGDATAVTPTSNEELEKYLADDTERVILLNKEFDFTGTTASGAGCDKSTCSAKSGGGQYYLGDLSCGGSDMTAVSSITYDAAGTTALKVGSNKSILGVGGKGVIKGKGLSIAKGASNVIIQGVEFTTINPGIVWGGDALDMQGGNTKIWVGTYCPYASCV
jgi:pectate lyase